VRRYREALERDGRGHEEQAGLTGEAVARRAEEGDALALRVVRDAGQALGVAVASMAMTLSIDTYVIGGGVVQCGELLLEPARETVPHYAYRSVGSQVRILRAALADDGPLLGCAWLARQAVEAGRPHTPTAHPIDLTASQRVRLEKVEGVIFDIQRYSLHDGPGLRTNVFLKGCPLDCQWCANPESQRLQPELALFVDRCIECGQFETVCPLIWDGVDQSSFPEELKKELGKRAEACPTEAIRWVGERRTTAEVIAQVLRDKPFYGKGGGMTLTGGEPTVQYRFAEALLRLAKAANISTAIETSGFTSWDILERMLPYLDFILFDLKHMDNETHYAFTSIDNKLVLSNLRRLVAFDTNVIVRVPLIPGFNATHKAMGDIAQFLGGLNGAVETVELLPYHMLGNSKYKALSRVNRWEGHARLPNVDIESLADVLRNQNLTVRVGG
jgi:pyruvate formate lyase activating enzyme